MSIAEVREFFLRNVKVSDGTLQDREKNYPLSHFVNKAFVDDDGLYSIRKVEVGNRFLEGDVPAVETWSKLLQSIPFFLNLESNASNSRQGLVKIATDAQVATSTEKDTDGFYLVPTAKQLGSKANNITNYSTISGNFLTTPSIAYNIALKSINGILYAKILIANTSPLTTGAQIITLNVGITNVVNASCKYDFPSYSATFGPRQSNGDISLTLSVGNKFTPISDVNPTNYSSGWLMIL